MASPTDYVDKIDIRDLTQDNKLKDQRLWFPVLGLEFRPYVALYYPRSAPKNREPQKIPIRWTRPHFGGRRCWFVCHCSRKVRILYVMGWYLFCRECCGSTYLSQTSSVRRRLYAKAQDLCRRLWNENPPAISELPSKPRGMHKRTYQRLLDRLAEIEEQLRTSRLSKPRVEWG